MGSQHFANSFDEHVQMSQDKYLRFKANFGALIKYYETNDKTTCSYHPFSSTHPKHGTDPSESEVFDRPELQVVLRGFAAAKVPEP